MPSSRRISRWMTSRSSPESSARPRFRRADLHQKLHAHQRISDLVGHARRQLPDRRQLLGSQDFLLLLLDLFRHLADALDEPLQPFVEDVEAGGGIDVEQPHFLVDIGVFVANEHEHARDGAMQAAGDAETADEAANRPEHAEQ